MSKLPSVLFQRWYHSQEEDSPQERVYRPAHFPFPRRRGARNSFELRPDGTCTEYRAGPADRSMAEQGRWQADSHGVVRVILGGRESTLEITASDDPVLRIRRRPGGTSQRASRRDAL
jgi:hypothetical protein